MGALPSDAFAEFEATGRDPLDLDMARVEQCYEASEQEVEPTLRLARLYIELTRSGCFGEATREVAAGAVARAVERSVREHLAAVGEPARLSVDDVADALRGLL